MPRASAPPRTPPWAKEVTWLSQADATFSDHLTDLTTLNTHNSEQLQHIRDAPRPPDATDMAYDRRRLELSLAESARHLLEMGKTYAILRRKVYGETNAATRVEGEWPEAARWLVRGQNGPDDEPDDVQMFADSFVNAPKVGSGEPTDLSIDVGDDTELATAVALIGTMMTYYDDEPRLLHVRSA